jgi:dTDP-6-deoxy-L-talose 4-dehydrogenase (NAD+)
MTTIAVTGASGFIGRHVLAALAQTRADVMAHARSLPVDHASTDRLRWCAFDISDGRDAFARLGAPDIVIHLAWEGLPNYLSARHVDVELPRQVAFLRSLAEAGLKRLVVAGTCFEYGMQSGCLGEDAVATPANPYAVAKDRLRQELESLRSELSFDLHWLRLFYLYGRGQGAGSLCSLFAAAVARGDRTFDMSPGDQVRDFMPVEGAAAAIVAVATATQPPALLNVCSGEPMTVRSLVERWRADLAADIELRLGVLPYPSYEPFAFWGDSTRLRVLLGAQETAA